jgi:uncharacterized protein YjcR
VPKARSENREKAYKIFQEHGGKITNRAIADQLSISEKTVGGWKCKDKWEDKLNGVLRKNKRSTPKEKKKRGAQPGSKNALGNKGGNGGPPGNDHAVKHGFFARIFPDDEETMAIVDEINGKRDNTLNILWENIVIQYTAIARAQKLMFVKDQEDITEHLKKRKVQSDVKNKGTRDKVDYQAVENYREEEWEFQFAWDKHANFLKAQSRAIQTLERLIARYEEMLLKDLDTEEQKLRIDKMKLEIEKIKNPGDVDIQTYLDALNQTAQDVWADEIEDIEPAKNGDGEDEKPN